MDKSIDLVYKVLKKKKDYNLISFNTFYIYTVYLDKLEFYLNSLNKKSFDTTLTAILDWDSGGSAKISKTIQNLMVDALFLLQDLQ